MLDKLIILTSINYILKDVLEIIMKTIIVERMI